MSALDFARTPIGRTFFDVTLPRIADELARLNKTLEPIAVALQAVALPPNARGSAGAGETGLQAALDQLARGHLPIDAIDPQTAALGLPETIASALGIALRAACQAGVAETLRTLRASPRDEAETAPGSQSALGSSSGCCS